MDAAAEAAWPGRPGSPDEPMERAVACRSGADQPGDRLRGFADLGFRRVSALGYGVGDAVIQVFIEQAESHRLQRPRHRRDLGEDVDAVLVALDHALEPADLPLDAAQSREVAVFVLGVPVHGTPPVPTDAKLLPYPRAV